MQQGHQINLPALTYVNKIIMIVCGVVFIVDSLLMKSGSFSLASLFALYPAKFLSGHIHTLFLYPLLNTSLMGVIFNCLLLWFIGSELEQTWGRKRYILFILVSYIGAGLFYIAIGSTFFSGSNSIMTPFIGLHGIASALCMAYGVLFPNNIFSFMLIFPMKAKYFCIILIGMELYMGFIQGALQSWGHLAAMVFAFAFMWSLTKPFMKNLVDSIGSSDVKRAHRVKKSHLRIVQEDDDNDKPPKYLQ